MSIVDVAADDAVTISQDETIVRMTAEGSKATEIGRALGRSAVDVHSRLTSFKNATMKKGPFSPEEVGGRRYTTIHYRTMQCKTL
jgi:hypothetical protein